jgi:hypothetical protein
MLKLLKSYIFLNLEMMLLYSVLALSVLSHVYGDIPFHTKLTGTRYAFFQLKKLITF